MSGIEVHDMKFPKSQQRIMLKEILICTWESHKYHLSDA